jgi:CRP/FNR family transcriptional regulator
MLLAQLAGDDDEYGWGEPMGLADDRRHH